MVIKLDKTPIFIESNYSFITISFYFIFQNYFLPGFWGRMLK